MRVTLGLVVPGAADQKQIRMGERRHFAEHGMGRGNRSRPPFAMRQHVAGEMIGERRLADAFRSDQEPGVMHPAAGQDLAEFGARRIVTKQAIDLARRKKSFEAIRLFERSYALFGGGPAHGRKRSATASQTSSATSGSGLRASVPPPPGGSSVALSR